jgi:acetyl-CoA carboxylase biotin carboxyl carrier protein
MKAEAKGGRGSKKRTVTRTAEPSRCQEIREILDLLRDTDIEEIELSWGDLKVRVKKRAATAGGIISSWSAPAAPPPAAGSFFTPHAASTSPALAPPEEKAAPPELVTVQSPMVGTFYRAPFPGAEPFVKEGDIVEKGQILCIIEAMKLMNEIEAEIAGRIESILVENAQPVEYGQPLFLIRPLWPPA